MALTITFDQAYIKLNVEAQLKNKYGDNNVKIVSDVVEMPKIRKHTTTQELIDWCKYHRYDSCAYKIFISGKMYYLYFRNGMNPHRKDFTRLSSYILKPYDNFESHEIKKHITDIATVKTALNDNHPEIAAQIVAESIVNDLATIL